MAAVWAHEWCHLLTATALVAGGACSGYSYKQIYTFENLFLSIFRRRVELPLQQNDLHSRVIRHAGWIGSLFIALVATFLSSTSASISWPFVAQGSDDVFDWSHGGRAAFLCGVWKTALEAVGSDMLGIPSADKRGHHDASVFHCGNFGVILIGRASRAEVRILIGRASRAEVMATLQKMIEVTMVRGAQSGGLMTYWSIAKGYKGARTRVVNGKRSDLAELLMLKFLRREAIHALTSTPSGQRESAAPEVFQGHTRFATSSITNLEGAHPHQWTPPRLQSFWYLNRKGYLKRVVRSVEIFVTHNGDFDFWKVNGTTIPLEKLQSWLPGVLDAPLPSPVDSCAIPGLLDILRTQGLWNRSVRFACIFGLGAENGIDDPLPSFEEITLMGQLFETTLESVLQTSTHFKGDTLPELRARLKANLYIRAQGDQKDLFERTQLFTGKAEEIKASLDRFIECAVDAFFDNDLLHATRFFLQQAKGSFGLVVSCSLEADKEVIVAAQGQTMSVAFYPHAGLVLFGSELAATKAALLLESHHGRRSSRRSGRRISMGDVSGAGYSSGAYRVDLDAFAGELVRVSWNDAKAGSGFCFSAQNKGYSHRTIMECGGYSVQTTLANVRESASELMSTLRERQVPLHDNPLVLNLPETVKDPVGKDIADIPRVLHLIQAEWAEGAGMNRVTAYNFYRDLRQVLKNKASAGEEHDPRRLDLLITGCEVSLWVAEQFAADLKSVLPELNVVAFSANKVLGLLGQVFPLPTIGHQFSHDFDGTLVLLVSHSGGTFAPLAVANLMKAFSSRLFVVTSEWDTQIGLALHRNNTGLLNASVFSTNVGFRPAEPSSVSLIAIQQMLTQLLLYIINREAKELGAAGEIRGYELAQLESMNQDCIKALEDIVGVTRHGEPIIGPTAAQGLRQQGRTWAQHVLEAPIAWILSAMYIVITVVAGVPPASTLYSFLGDDATVPKLFLLVDAVLYVFLPLWITFLLRLLHGRTVLHRLGTRTVVVGDVPWVSQSIDAFLSKLFACSYSIASIHVLSGNPADHFVHRHTHRVVRGTLLAVGRPDSRLNGLASTEQAVNLSVKQASSIANLTSTCESITLGHAPDQLNLTANHIVLTDARKRFLCELLGTNRLQLRNDSSTDSPAIRTPNITDFSKRLSNKMWERITSPKAAGPRGRVRRSELFPRPTRMKNREASGMLGQLYSLQGEKGEGDGMGARVDSSGSLQESIAKDIQLGTKIEVADEPYFGKGLEDCYPTATTIELMRMQVGVQHIYESRIASLQRCVAFMVMFHEMGSQVQNFWPRVSLGFLGYNMARTQSCMRIATTSSPVTASDLRNRMLEIRESVAVARLKKVVLKDSIDPITTRQESPVISPAELQLEMHLEKFSFDALGNSPS
ncbi:hypothetical protein CYMTET_20918 [Cymbomonas tetramitiformis]|uniref:Glutamine amidotransferase type-2 domain-containing protein n=1 Tax=Cymbomonas tetramitiformis TaxID=36881 RepID=A0AAE0G338_9CHLO|nr:hypothetical protein CYMTET_20918 [Cymbomonas tetramitiformis]